MGTQSKITGEITAIDPLALVHEEDSELDNGSAAITSSGAGNTNDGNDYLDLGPATVAQILKAVIRVLNTDTADADETYDIAIQISDATDFNTGGSATFVVDVANVNPLATGVAVSTDGDDIAFTRFFSNFVKVEPGSAPVYGRYVRAYHTLAGTTPSITANISIGPENP